MKDIWNRYEAEIGVADIEEKGISHCDWKARIHIDLEKTAKGRDNSTPFQTAVHECGHAIDMIAGRNAAGASACSPENLYSMRYKNGLFPRTIKQEVEALIEARDKIVKADFKNHPTDYDWLYSKGYIASYRYDFFKKYGQWLDGVPKYSKSITYEAIEDEIGSLSRLTYGDLSDIMEGATRERIYIGVGHGNKYWKNGDWTLATEAFAEMMDSLVTNPESLSAIQKYLPNSYNMFLDILNDIKQNM